MLIRNVHIENAAAPADVRVENRVFEALAPSLPSRPGEEILDGTGCLLLPPFVESHVHLDTCLTAGDPVWNMSGTLFEGIECWAQRKARLTAEDVKDRAGRALRMYAAHGVQAVRTHVDVTDPQLTALHALLELRDQWRDTVTLQIVAFPQEGICSYPNGKGLMEQAVALGADCVGAIPHFEFTREYAVESLNFCMALAEKYDRLVDVHCDEIDDPESRGLETLACRALESGLRQRVTASHTTAMHSYNNAYCSRLFRLLRLSDINFVCNPLVNTHLQGRFDAYPKRRGVTRVRELLQNGNTVAFGHDDIFDPWYPLGNGDMRDVVHMGLHVCQMLGYQEIQDSYRCITHNAARVLNLGPEYGIGVGNPASFIILEGTDFHSVLSRRGAVLHSYRQGRCLASTTPAHTKTHLPGDDETPR